jgi:DNA repair photolyase
MKQNNSNGNMYPGFKTWNPLGGECSHKCTYCSTHSWKKRMETIRVKYSGPLRLDYNALSKNLGKGNTYFVVAQNDLFQHCIPEHWIHEVFNHCKKFDNTYLFQTKNPERFIPVIKEFPAKSILCTTIETNRIYPQMGNTPRPDQRSYAMNCISEFSKQVTLEPIMDFDLSELVTLIKMANPVSVNIGADSKGHHLPEPSKEKLLALINELQKFTVIDRKTNLSRLLK